MRLKIIDVNSKPPFDAVVDLRAYLGGVAKHSRIKRGLPTDPALESCSMDMFLKQHAYVGVTRTIVHARASGPGADPDAVHEVITNEDVLALCREYPEAFSGIASVDAIGDPEAVTVCEKAIDAGFVGITLLPGYMPVAARVDDPRLFPVYETCIARDVPVVLLNGGNAGPDMSYSDAVNIDRVAGLFPRLKIMVGYAGWPYVQPMMGVLYRRKNVWLMTDSYFPAMPGERDYLMALNSYAQDRFLFSFYYPLNPQRQHLERVLALGLSQLTLDRLLHGNAAELFNLT